MKTIGMGTAVLAAIALAAPASAAYTFDFSFDDDFDDSRYSYAFTLDDPAAPTYALSDEIGFANIYADVCLNGSCDNLIGDIRFYARSQGGGFDATYAGYGFYGPQLYTGSTAAPRFTPGTFDLYVSPDGVRGKLTITSDRVDAAVPEPASWAMMVAGFGAFGGVLRRRRPLAPVS